MVNKQSFTENFLTLPLGHSLLLDGADYLQRRLSMEKGLMTIGEIAEFYGVSRKAMRLYEKKGIIKPVKVDPANGYRYYSVAQVK